MIDIVYKSMRLLSQAIVQKHLRCSRDKQLLLSSYCTKSYFPFGNRFPVDRLHPFLVTNALMALCRLRLFLSSIKFFGSINLLFEFPEDFSPEIPLNVSPYSLTVSTYERISRFLSSLILLILLCSATFLNVFTL